MKSLDILFYLFPLYTAISDIPEGWVLVSPQNARFFIFSDRLLTISHAMYLVSNKVTSNRTEITIFLHISYIYLRTCHPSSPKFELLKIVLLGRWKKVSNTWQTVLRESNTTRNSRYLTLIFQFSCSTECRQSPFCLPNWRIFSKYTKVTTR